MSAPVKQTDVQEYLNACSEIIGDPAVTNKVGPAAMKIGRYDLIPPPVRSVWSLFPHHSV